jgi:predicted dehydrogenase
MSFGTVAGHSSDLADAALARPAPKAAVAGVGFIGLVHIEALRRLGIDVVGVVAGSTDGAARASLPPTRIYETYEQLLDDATVDVVHIATPNHLHYDYAMAALAAGKHVICEKPLALTPAQTGELAAFADRSGLVHCVNFNLRFYPQVQEARARVARGDVGGVWNVHGSYLQDWLLYPTDWNWRLEPELGGPLRVVGDIGCHWLDLAEFISNRRIVEVCADLATALPTRQRPVRRARTFEAADEGPREPVDVTTEDAAHLLIRFEDGARGSCMLSQVSAGRRNALSLQVDGAAGAIAWSSDRSEELWLGHRDRPNETFSRDPALMAGPVRGTLPPGHGEGFENTFKTLYAAVYSAVAAGGPRDGYPSFHDGHRAATIGAAILRSHVERAWVEVPA